LSITSKDKEYHGLLYEAKSKVCCLFLHGTASNFYEEKWVEADSSNNVRGNQIVTGSISVTNSVTASFFEGTINGGTF
jgi:hypothetical protein